jgi:hypothetical protein
MHSKALLALALSSASACAHTVTRTTARAPVASRAATRPVAPTPTVQPPHAPPPPLDLSSLSLRAAVEGWVRRAGERAGRRLSLAAVSEPRATPWERDSHAFDATVRDEDSHERVTLSGLASRMSYRGAPWIAREDFFERNVAEAFALRGAAEWLSARPEVFGCARVALEALTFVWFLTTADATTMCAETTPAHGLPIRGCWVERSAPTGIEPGSFDYWGGGRPALRGRFATTANHTVRVSIDEQGRVSRASSARGPLRVASRTSAPDLGPLAELVVRVEPATEAGVTALLLSSETESRRCVRRARWTCEPVRAGLAP